VTVNVLRDTFGVTLVNIIPEKLDTVEASSLYPSADIDEGVIGNAVQLTVTLVKYTWSKAIFWVALAKVDVDAGAVLA
jgi:hypothetical protein